MTVHNLGSINIDHVYRVTHFVRPGETLASHALETVLGGKGANQSVALARAGARVRHMGRIGEADQWARDALADAGVDVSAVGSVPGASGHAIIQVDQAGENAILLHGGANQAMDRDALEDALSVAEEGDLLLMQNETSGIADAFEIAASRGLRIAFNPAPMSAAVRALPLERCDTLILNETEAVMLAAENDADALLESPEPVDARALEARLSERFPGVRLVLTLGAQGARLARGDSRIKVPATVVEVVDTTGAGDTFVGYLLAALEAGMDDQDALSRGCMAAALAVTQAGATPSIPQAASVDALLQSQE